jgi:hypothetical protein
MDLFILGTNQLGSEAIWTSKKAEPPAPYSELIAGYDKLFSPNRERMERTARELLTQDELKRLFDNLEALFDYAGPFHLQKVDLPLVDTGIASVADYAMAKAGRMIDLGAFGYRGYLPPKGKSWDEIA